MTIEVCGYCDDKFSKVKDLLASSVQAGDDLGASFAATVDGEMVVDLWAGTTDEAQTSPWEKDTIVNVYSTTKTMSFLCALVLADRGQLDFDASVATYWPEFAQNGKESIKVWHLMNHAAGLSGLEVPVSTSDMYDWDKITGLLAAQAPWWEPGTATGYHAITQGYLIGEVVKRISGRSLGQFFAEEIAQPLDADFHIGVPEDVFPRIGCLIPPGGGDANPAVQGDQDSIVARTFRNPPVSALESRTSEWRKAEIPAANGHGNARSVARVQSVLACMGEVDGVRLLSEETAKSVMIERISGTDLVLGVPMSFGLGYGLNPVVSPVSPSKNVCGWGGWGGSVIVVDQDVRASISYVMNKMNDGLTGDMRSANLISGFYQSL